jgi:N-acetylmuramate 1-kinase
MSARADMADAFLRDAGWGNATRQPITGDASNRRYERLTRPDGSTTVLMDAPPDRGEDVRPFVVIARHLSAQGFSAPAIMAEDPEAGFLLIEDLGDGVFARLMAEDPDRQNPLYRAAVEVLAALHVAPVPKVPPCDADWLIDKTDLYFDWYLPAGTAPDGFDRFARAFAPFAKEVAAAPGVLILRDYHAENLLWLPDREGVARVGLLDFQDALAGHPAYDLVSILQDARRDVAEDTKAAMIEHYLSLTEVARAPFLRAFAILGVQRNLRILGIFARLAKRDGRPHYADMIPRVWHHLCRDLAHPDLGPLSEVLEPLLPAPTPEFLEELRRPCPTAPAP